MYLVKEMLYDVASERFLDERVRECPDDVDATNILSYLVGLYGEPNDIVKTEVPELGIVPIGWVFDSSPPSQTELFVIPMLRDGEGNLEAAFVRQEREQREMQRLAAELGAELKIVEAPPQPYDQ